MDNIHMKTIKFTNKDVYGKPTTVLLNTWPNGEHKQEVYHKIPYTKEYKNYITIKGENYG